MLICETLHNRIASPSPSSDAERVAVIKAERIAYIEALCSDATGDLLCWSMEKGLAQGDAQAEPLAFVVRSESASSCCCAC